VIIQSCGTDCSKETGFHPDCGCPSGQTAFNENCVQSDNYTYYFGLVDFYCFQDSIAIGIDNLAKTAILLHDENGGFGSTGPIPYSEIGVDGFSANECILNDITRTIFLLFDDKASIDQLPSEVYLTMYLKESAFFGSNTIDSTQISVTRR
jgi:hypothetical protein